MDENRHVALATPFADHDLFMRYEADQNWTPTSPTPERSNSTTSLNRSNSFQRSFSTRSTDQLLNIGERSSICTSPLGPGTQAHNSPAATPQASSFATRSFSTRSTEQLLNIGERSALEPIIIDTHLSPAMTPPKRNFSTLSTEQLLNIGERSTLERMNPDTHPGPAMTPPEPKRSFSTLSTEQLLNIGERSFPETSLRTQYMQPNAAMQEHVPDTRSTAAYLKYYNLCKYYAKEVGQYVYLVLAVYGIPIALVAFLPSVRSIFFWIGSSSIFVTTGWLVSEAFASYHSWNSSRKLHSRPLPDNLPLNVAAIISAYLPNEIGVIRETVDAVSSLNLPVGGRMKVVVAHNGGSNDDVAQLSIIIDNLMRSMSVEVQNLHVTTSRSKAENVNAAIKHLSEQIRPQVCVMYDADHQPDINAMVYALHSMTVEKADLLQGRCVIKRGSPLLAAEFDTIYGVNHAGGSVLRRFAFFGGTNGYWRFDLLARIGMDETMLTEDIDSSFRSLAKGAKIIFDPKVASYEEAPDSISSLMKQRLRWAQGWSQVAARHVSLLGKDEFSSYKKFMIFMVLHWREIFYYLTPLTLPAAVASLVNKSKFAYPLIAVTVIQLGVPPLLALLARYHVGSDRHPDLGPCQYLKYLIVAPLYDSIKNAVCVLGHFRNVCNMTKWRVTSRSTRTVDI